jgi:hypothetical protein
VAEDLVPATEKLPVGLADLNIEDYTGGILCELTDA